MRWLRYPWLFLGKSAALVFIFIGGGVLALTVLPLLSLWPGHPRGRAQYLIHMSFRFYIFMLKFFGMIGMEVVGAEKLSACGGQIVVANHPSLLDVVILMAFIPKVQCIVKHELWNHRPLGHLMRRAEYIRNDLDPETLVEACRASLGEGRCLIVFPEGTRTPPGTLPRFQRGFANLATLTKTPIQTVFISCDPPFLFKGERWWRVPPQKPFFRVVVGERLDADSYLLYGQRSIAARKLVESLENYYAQYVRNR